jgi:hypothetical protein
MLRRMMRSLSETRADRIRSRWRSTIPELNAYEAVEALLEDWNTAMLRCGLWSVLLALPIGLLWVLIVPLAGPGPVVQALAAGALGFLSPFLFSNLAVLVCRGKVRAVLRSRLAKRGIPVCVRCAYDLRGSGGRCPECGLERE